jgi:hypothetical protein
MQLPSQQRGLGLWGWIFVLGTLGFITMITLQLIPMYLNEMAIAKVVKSTAGDPGNSGLAPAELRKAMQTRWDIEAISTLEPRDVKIVKHSSGRALSYDYEARAPLFYNIFIVVHFQNSFPMKGGGGSIE